MTTPAEERSVMTIGSRLCLIIMLLFLVPAGRAAALSPAPPDPPSVQYGELYRAVEMAQIFPDQKTFADAIPKQTPAEILAAYGREKTAPGFNLKAFVSEHFTPPPRPIVQYAWRAGRGVADYVDDMWTVLERKPDQAEPGSSL